MKRFTSLLMGVLALGGCTRQAQPTTPLPVKPPEVYWELEVGLGVSEKVSDEPGEVSGLDSEWKCKLEEVEREFDAEDDVYAEYRGLQCSKGDAYLRAQAGCRFAIGRGKIWQTNADLQLSNADISRELRWQMVGLARERALDDPSVVIPTVPPHVLLQCQMDVSRSQPGWALKR